jgi:peptidoglycan hydrolase CwlO-like protein
MKVEYKYKLERIKEIKKEIKETVQDLDTKKETLLYLTSQWEKMPKDINRNQYLKRINEIIAKLKIQKTDIGKMLMDI